MRYRNKHRPGGQAGKQGFFPVDFRGWLRIDFQPERKLFVTATAIAMSEETLWKGNPSQMLGIGHYAGAFVVAVGIVLIGVYAWSPAYYALILPFGWAVWTFLSVRCEIYELSTERLRLYVGVINQKIDELELYRVKDTTTERPLFLRVFGLSNILLETSDRSHPQVTLRAVRDAVNLRETLRKQVEHQRDSKRVREVDFQDGDLDGEMGDTLG